MKGAKVAHRFARKPRKANRSELVKMRDEALVWRHYYYQEVKRLRFDDTVAELGKDFYLAETTVLIYLNRLLPLLEKLHNASPSLVEVLEKNGRFSCELSADEKKRYKLQNS